MIVSSTLLREATSVLKNAAPFVAESFPKRVACDVANCYFLARSVPPRRLLSRLKSETTASFPFFFFFHIATRFRKLPFDVARGHRGRDMLI